jgi:hypothetical protein
VVRYDKRNRRHGWMVSAGIRIPITISLFDELLASRDQRATEESRGLCCLDVYELAAYDYDTLVAILEGERRTAETVADAQSNGLPTISVLDTFSQKQVAVWRPHVLLLHSIARKELGRSVHE